jgi:hypothetical protein
MVHGPRKTRFEVYNGSLSFAFILSLSILPLELLIAPFTQGRTWAHATTPPVDLS